MNKEIKVDYDTLPEHAQMKLLEGIDLGAQREREAMDDIEKREISRQNHLKYLNRLLIIQSVNLIAYIGMITFILLRIL